MHQKWEVRVVHVGGIVVGVGDDELEVFFSAGWFQLPFVGHLTRYQRLRRSGEASGMRKDSEYHKHAYNKPEGGPNLACPRAHHRPRCLRAAPHSEIHTPDEMRR